MTRFEMNVMDSIDAIQEYFATKDMECKSAGMSVSVKVNETSIDSIINEIKDIICHTFDSKKPANEICKLNVHGNVLFIRFKREIHC